MKINKKYLKAGIFIAVYLFALYLWTLPFQDNRIPYGEFDAISHWGLGDFIAQRDRTFVYLPPFLDLSYGTDNKYKPHTLWYHPPFHTDFAIVSAISGGGMVPIYLTNAIFATSILISVFFVIIRLYGFLPAILSSFMLTFSLRDIMPYLWGQWPERFAYAFIPIALYCFYKYYTSYSKENSRPIYLYIMALILAVNMMIHPLVFFHSLVGLFILGIGLFIKIKKIPINIKHIGIALSLFLVLFAIFPYQTGNVIVSFTKSSSSEDKTYSPLSRLLHWAPNPEDFVGSVPESYFSFKEMHGLWTIPFLLLGILILAIRRENRDIFLLAWLISLYLILHRDLIGKSIFIHRSLSATAHIFVPITVIGALSIFSLFKIPKNYKIFLKYGGAALIVVLTLIYNAPLAFKALDTAYDGPLARLNPSQIEVSKWLEENLEENDEVSIIGVPDFVLQKVWWMTSISHRPSYFYEGFLKWGKEFAENREERVRNHTLNDYLVLDYSDISRYQQLQPLYQQWLTFEEQNLGNHTIKYTTKDGTIKVLKYENNQ